MVRVAILAILASGCLYENNPGFGADDGAGTSGVAQIDDAGPTTTSTSAPTTDGTSTDGTSTDGMTGSDDSTGEPAATSTGTTTSGGCATPADWWDPAWPRRRPVTIDNAAGVEDLVDFATLVVIEPEMPDDAELRPDGADIRFVEAGTDRVMAHHFETFAAGAAKHAWVNVPEIGARSTDALWMYYGRADAEDVQDPAGSYDEDTVAVFHLSEAAGAHSDSAGGIACLWGGGGGTQDAEGFVGGANEFDGAQDEIDCGTDQIADTVEATITAWVRLDLAGDVNQSIVSLESTQSPFRGLSLYVRRNDGAIGKWFGNGPVYAADAANRVEVGEWAFLAIRTRRNMADGFIEVSTDGGPWETLVDGMTASLSIVPGTPLVLGRWPGGGANSATDGTVDEIKIAKTLRSDAWVHAQHRSESGLMASVGPEQSLCP